MAQNQEGMTLGSYRVISQIGKGGMATVYKAYQASMDRYIALKILPQYHSNDPSFAQRFIQEAHIIAQLEHKNILPVYDFGDEEGVSYMAMRYLDGGNLQEILSQGQLAFTDIVDIMGQICEGLDYAHRQGIVHRDIKPSNIMLDSEGTIYIADFGFAKILKSSSELTVTGTVMGTPLYMAPEQSVGGEVDARTDIYAMGVILFEMVTGQPPFQAETPMAVVLAHIHNPLPIPQTINPNVPDDIQNIILKALSKDPEHRYQTAKELSESLARAAKKIDIVAEATTLGFLTAEVRESLASKAILPTDKNFTPVLSKLNIQTKPQSSPLKLIFGGIAVLALVVIAVFLGVMFSRDQPSQTSELAVEPAVEPMVESAPEATPAAPILFDDFNNPDYDGTVNTRIWRTDIDKSCLVTQSGGELIVTNESVDYDMDTCDLLIGHPESVKFSDLESIEAKIFFASGYKGDYAGQSLMLSTTLLSNDNYWYALCGSEVADDELVAGFWIARITSNGAVTEEYYASSHIEPDTWYTYKMEIEPETGTLSCLRDGDLVGSTILENLEELRTLNFERGLTAWRAPHAISTTKIDDFWLIP
ncbi:MAG: serine/threonine-protein kinase [Chloroflexota bacterium]|nr:serine/threonine-protein kinase [Chloroflexota bacterium]